MFKKIRTILLAGIVASALAVSAGAHQATEDFSVWGKKDSSNWLLITIGVLAFIIIIGMVYLLMRRNASK